MVTECGNCHQAVGIFPSPSTPRTPDVGGLVGHMLEHKRAADEMLQGLVIPSASRWQQGADRLRVAALRPSQLPFDSKMTADIRKAEDRVHQAANQAADAGTTAERAAAYVQVLTTCAECHGLHKVWGPLAAR
jgi:cytochrome c553